MSFERKLFRDQLHQLVATRSISCTNPTLDTGNCAIVKILANWLDDKGFSVEVCRVDDHPNKANLIVTLGASNHPDSQGGRSYRYRPLR